MAGRRPERSILAMIWSNFRESLMTVKRLRGTIVGKDYLGTSYYELPAEPRRGKRRPSRWFETATEKKEKFDQEIPAEWEAWLRGRREDPPSEKEVNINLALAQSKKIKAGELYGKMPADEKRTSEPIEKSKVEYPKYGDYETTPGKPADKP